MLFYYQIIKREIRHLKNTQKIKSTIEFLNKNYLESNYKIEIDQPKNYCFINKDWDRYDCFSSLETVLYSFFINNRSIFSKWQREDTNSHFYKFIKRHKMKVWTYERLLKYMWNLEDDGKNYYESIIKKVNELLSEEQKAKFDNRHKMLLWALEQPDFEEELLDRFSELDRNWKLNELRYKFEFCRSKSKNPKF